MPDVAALYPPNPAAVPPDLTRPPGSYRKRVVLVLCCLFLFLAVYLAVTVGSAYACYYCFDELVADGQPRAYTATELRYNPRTGRSEPQQVVRHMPREQKPALMLVVGGLAGALIFLFMVKGLFKRSRPDGGSRVEVTEKEQPELFAFIRKLCADTRAPFPHRVFLVPDVNAAVAYNESFLNLIRPAPKNLIIGLGLVNRLNLTEFKAVLAHEFGHFSQKSMKLGRYVYTANKVVADVVYARDWLDDAVAAATRTDIRIAVFAWAVQGTMWGLRKVLVGLFRVTNFANASLSRQMEYNADLVAASVTGSDALVFALARLDLASDSLGQAWTDLTHAAEHGHVTRDLYFHQTRAAEYLRAKWNDPKRGTVPELPQDPAATVQVFKADDVSVPRMWATHPANHDREANLKARYFRGPTDDREAWSLFRDQDTIRAAVTAIVYAAGGRKKEQPEDPEVVQAFIDAEHAETTHDPRYHGLYENRYIKPGDPDELFGTAVWVDYDDPEKLAAAHARLFDDLKTRMDEHRKRQDEGGRLAQIKAGAVELRGKDFEFRGSRHQLRDAERLLKQVQGEIDKDFEWMHLVDRWSFGVHFAMAKQLGLADRVAFEERYRFHLAAQTLYARLSANMQEVQGTLAGIAGQRELQPHVFQYALGVVRNAHSGFEAVLGEAEKLPVPALTNVAAGTPLRGLLHPGAIIRALPADTQSLGGEWLNDFLNQLGGAIDRGARVLFKSLGGLLALQQDIGERWHAAGKQEPANPER